MILLSQLEKTIQFKIQDAASLAGDIELAKNKDFREGVILGILSHTLSMSEYRDALKQEAEKC